MHQNTRKFSFFAIFKLMTHIFPIFLLISGSKIAAQEIRIGSGVNFKTDHFSLILPDGFDQRSVDTAGVILSVRYLNSFPTLNIVEAPGSSNYPAHLAVGDRVLESYRAVGFEQAKVLEVKTSKFGQLDLSEPLVSLVYTLNDEKLKAEVGFINLKDRYFTITLVERALAEGDELNAGRTLRSNLKWVGTPPFGKEVGGNDASLAKHPLKSNSALKDVVRQSLGIVGIIIGVYLLVKIKNLLWKRLFR